MNDKNNSDTGRPAPNLFGTPWGIHEPCMEMITNAVDDLGTVQAIMARKGLPADNTEGFVRIRDRVAVVEIIGPVFQYDNIMSWIFGWPSNEGLMQDIQALEENPAVEAIVLHVDSPGGAVGGTAELAAHIRNNISKPVVAYVNDMCASAAYWIASAADYIVAAVTAELGSIGVVFTMRRRSDNTIEVVSAVSPKKRVDPDTEAGRASLQARADAIAEVFVDTVAQNRQMKQKEVTALGGDVVIAAKAVQMGLADEIGSLEQVIAGLNNNNQYFKKGEITMNLEKLKKDHPELYAQVMESGRAEGRTEVQTTMQTKLEAAQAKLDADVAAAKAETETAASTAKTQTLDMVTVVLGDNARSAVDQVIDAGMTAEQVKMARQLFGNENQNQDQNQNPSGGNNTPTRQQILDGIHNATPPAAPPANDTGNDNPAEAFIEKVNFHQKTNECRRSEAIGIVAQSSPELYQAWLADQQKK